MPASSSVQRDVDGSAMRTVYDRTSYNIIPTPPSPSHSSPTLTQSTSNSHSSGSPPQPTTPPRTSRSRSRYPDLGRVPLHRRGTSKTYERLEDLLREAGYKETRVFTPEGERGDGDNDEKKDQRNSVRGGMGAVVGFLTGLVNSSASTARSSAQATATSQQELQPQSPQLVYSPPMSPLTHLRALKDHGHDIVSTPTTAINSSTESLEPTPRPRYHNSSGPRTPHSSLPHQQQVNYSAQQDQEDNVQAPSRPPLPHQSSRTSVHRLHQPPVHAPTPLRLNSFSNSHPYSHGLVPPVPPFPASRAGAYLRHMASAPNMPQRPNSTPPQQQRTASRRNLLSNDSDSESPEFYGKRGNGEGEDDTASVISKSLAPNQNTWIGTMARAVLFGGSSVRVDRPQLYRTQSGRPRSPLSPRSEHQSQKPAPAVTGKMPELRQTRSSISHTKSTSSTSASTGITYEERGKRGRLSDQTNTSSTITPQNHTRTQHLAPPELFFKIERGRSGRSETEVSKMRVVCKSAPSSRTGSRVRGTPATSEDTSFGVLTIGLVAAVSMARNKSDSRDADHTRVPSLAKTKAEGEAWSKSDRKKGRDGERHRGRRRRVVTDADSYDSDMAVGRRLVGAHKPQPQQRRLDTTAPRTEQDDADDSNDSELDDDDEDDDGEPDLAKILGPPKRQNSIKSLRKHLTPSQSTTSLPSMPSKGPTTSPLTHAHPRLTVPEETEMEYTVSPSEERPSRASTSLLRAAGLLPPSRSSLNLDDPNVLYPSRHESPAGMRRRFGGGDVAYDGGESDGNERIEDGRRELFQRFLRGGSGRSATTTGQGSGSTGSGRPRSRLGLPAAWGGVEAGGSGGG